MVRVVTQDCGWRSGFGQQVDGFRRCPLPMTRYQIGCDRQAAGCVELAIFSSRRPSRFVLIARILTGSLELLGALGPRGWPLQQHSWRRIGSSALSELSRLTYSDRVDEPAQFVFWRSARE